MAERDGSRANLRAVGGKESASYGPAQGSRAGSPVPTMSPRSQENTPSIHDQLASLEQHIQRRMAELEPLAREYRELEQIACRLGLLGSERVRDGGREGRGLGNGRVRPGERHRQLLELIRDRPGITVRQAAVELDVDPTSLYRIVRRLVEDGEIEKYGLELRPL